MAHIPIKTYADLLRDAYEYCELQGPYTPYETWINKARDPYRVLPIKKEKFISMWFEPAIILHECKESSMIDLMVTAIMPEKGSNTMLRGVVYHLRVFREHTLLRIFSRVPCSGQQTPETIEIEKIVSRLREYIASFLASKHYEQLRSNFLVSDLGSPY